MRRAASLALLICAAPASAQPRCWTHDVAVAGLAQNYGEHRTHSGMIADPSGRIVAVMETFVNPQTGTWSVLLTSADKEACLVSSGIAFAPDAAVAKGDPT